MILKIFFNPAYDRGSWRPAPSPGKSEFNTQYVGIEGLMDILELRAGRKRVPVSQFELLSIYREALSMASEKNQKIFFNKSLALSPLSTAEQLLAWRNELILSGWTKDFNIPEGLTKGGKQILDGLAEVEKLLPEDFRTCSDAIMSMIRDAEDISFGENLEVTVAESSIHPAYSALLQTLRSKGIPVSVAPKREITHKTEILHFKDSSDAAMWATAQTPSLFVCADTKTFSGALSSRGLKTINTESSSSLRPVEHLFTSAMMLLAAGDNTDSLRDYLSSPCHPLNQFRFQAEDGSWRVLKEELLSNIIAQNGFGTAHLSNKSFEEIIKDFAGKFEEKDIRKFLPEVNQKLTFKRVKDLSSALSSWATGYMKNSDENVIVPQLSSLIQYCEAMTHHCLALGYDKCAEIKTADFLCTLRTVYSPSELQDGDALVGSVNVSPSIESIAAPVETAIWIDGYAKETRIPMVFMCNSDIELLTSAGLPFAWKYADVLASEDEALSAGLSMITGKLTILNCDNFLGEKRQKHPHLLLAASQKAGKGESSLDWLKNLPYEEIPDKFREACPSRNAYTQIKDYELGKLDITIPESTSPSTMEVIFERPFDWVINNILSLRKENESNLSTIKGTVAHDIIHRIVNTAKTEAKVTPSTFEKVFRTEYENYFTDAVLDCGAVLNLPENRSEREQFRYTLRERSIPKLIYVLEHSGLSIVGSEVRFSDVDISEQGYEPLVVKGSIDLLLENRAGNYVIFDFKWAGTTGLNERKEQVEKGEDWQLAVYRRAVEKGFSGIDSGVVEAQAFFMLQTAELITAYNGFNDENGPITVYCGSKQKTFSETIAEIQSRYSEIVRDLKNGKIREGEGRKWEGEKSTRPDNSFGDNQILKGKLR